MSGVKFRDYLLGLALPIALYYVFFEDLARVLHFALARY
jgi:hypothetical protein